MPRTSATGGQAAPWPKATLGLPAASALVIGTVIGTGIFALLSALAPYGPVSLVAFVVVTLGALALALTFGALSKRVPASGGPYVMDVLIAAPRRAVARPRAGHHLLGTGRAQRAWPPPETRT
ncbi:hypothetical protein [Streptomyces sp. NPDC051677]|uniref:hypothetical protein n=1 Tax=Streptomyces sp. NPDC051677 TaxID=3365669 RepID=UPI0037D2F169